MKYNRENKYLRQFFLQTNITVGQEEKEDEEKIILAKNDDIYNTGIVTSNIIVMYNLLIKYWYEKEIKN